MVALVMNSYQMAKVQRQHHQTLGYLSMTQFNFPFVAASDEEVQLRKEVRSFLKAELASGGYQPTADCWMTAVSPEFSEKLGTQGWLGMTWPKKYGGHERTTLDRLIVTEELLAAGAPVAAHWIADRQTGQQIINFGSEEQKTTILPKMVAGKSFAAIGMSEPQAGSDLAAVRTKAEKTKTGWRLNGRKIWSTGAHHCDYMIVLARTSPAEGRNRQVGLSQFLVPLKTPGVDVSGINDILNHVHFNETLFEDVDLAEDALLGKEGNGWAQCMGELALERSGPERFLSTFILLEQALQTLRGKLDDQGLILLGQLIAKLTSLRIMSRGIALQLAQGKAADTEAAMVKALGNIFEKEVVSVVRRLLSTIPESDWPETLSLMLDDAVLKLPANTLRGGTTEILRGIIARQLGAR